MSINMPDRYKKLIEEIKPFVEERGLDLVSVSSLIQGCVRFSDIEEENASVIFLDSDRLDGSKSIKFSNIKVSIKYALDVIFTAKMIPDEDDLWLILALLKTIVSLAGGMIKEISADEAAVLFAIYRLRKANRSEIKKYLLSQSDKLKNIEINNIDVEKTTYNLEKIGSIRMVDGRFRLIENVIIS